MQNISEVDEKSIGKKGCFYSFVFVLSFIWILGATITAQLLMWLMEQTIFEASHLFPDLRWLIIVTYIILVGLPLFLARFLLNDRFFNIVFKFWTSILLLGILTLSGKFMAINQAEIVSILQILSLVLYLSIQFSIAKRNNEVFLVNNKSQLLWISLLFGAVYSIPWVLWGAFGSILDLVLNFLVAFLSGLLMTFLIQKLFTDMYKENKKIEPAGKLFFGLIIFIGLMIFSTVLGQNGQQWLLVFTLPFTGWIIAGLFPDSCDEQRRSSFSIFVVLFFVILFPLIWFDPDELSLIVGSDPGEILSWVSQTISFSIVIIVIYSFIAWFLRRKFEISQIIKPIMGVSIFSWVGLLMIYLIFGQQGVYGESLFVVMADQADLSAANLLDDPEAKRKYVYETSTSYAEHSQKDIIKLLNRFKLEYEPFYLVNALEVKAGPLWKFIINQRDDVDRVLDNPNLRPLPESLPINEGEYQSFDQDMWNLKMIGVDKVWDEFKVFGAGIIIGQADSGVDGNHPALREQFAGNLKGSELSWFDPWYHSNFPEDISGHGTHTLGTVLGKNVGIAPESNWIGCVNLGRNLGNPGYYLTCMQFLFAPFPSTGNSFLDGKPELGAHILNNSWGCPEIEGCDSKVFEQAVYALRNAGVFIVASAGNSGYYGCESVTDPIAIYEDVFSVGAIDQLGELAQFSSLGPVTIDSSGRIKPDIVAPGVEIFSSMPNASYAKLSGTSMAGPHVVGTVALMWSAKPELIGNIELTEEILNNTADNYVGIYPVCVDYLSIPNNGVGYGVLNSFKAVEEAIKIR